MVLVTLDDIKNGKVKLSHAFPKLKSVHSVCKPYLDTGIKTRTDLQRGEVPKDASVWCPWAFASYGETKEQVSLQLQGHGLEEITPADSGDFYFGNRVLFPFDRCFFVAKKGDKIVISIRGTHAFEDIIADISTRHTKFEYDGVVGEAHVGFLNSANFIFQQRSARIVSLLRNNPTYGLVVTGHSLGGAVSLLLSFLLKKELKKQGLTNVPVECWTYGCPPCLSKEFVNKADFVHNVVYNDDVVSRASLRNLKIVFYENSDTAYLGQLEKYSQDVKANAAAIKKVIDTQRGKFKFDGSYVVCPGFLYHILNPNEHPEEEKSEHSCIAYVSKTVTEGFGIVIVSDTMVSDHSEYPKALLAQ